MLYLWIAVFKSEGDYFCQYFWAEDSEHAIEQAVDAEPYATLIGTFYVPVDYAPAREG